MSSGALAAVIEAVRQSFLNLMTSVMQFESGMRHTLHRMLHAAATTASILLSFEALVVVSFLCFAFLGGALCLFVLWPIIVESDQDEYDDCESGLLCDALHHGDGRPMVGVFLPVVLELEQDIDIDGQMNLAMNTFRAVSPRRERNAAGTSAARDLRDIKRGFRIHAQYLPTSGSGKPSS
ncbi:hypothetical protein B0H10DRAFT_2209616 [Mycena sp. CBHHK59/15]|nr:hypothetical protein B0H10DRAFT_2209616 [Mycena sp. CBHHK59/15]